MCGVNGGEISPVSPRPLDHRKKMSIRRVSLEHLITHKVISIN